MTSASVTDYSSSITAIMEIYKETIAYWKEVRTVPIDSGD